MGIQYLNRFMRDNCPKSINIISMSELSGKKIAIDTSIYLYRYNRGEDTLVENMYLMITLFKHYNIIPLFIFDGKPPAEKRALLIDRRKNKQAAETEYNLLQCQLKNSNENNKNNVNKKKIFARMNILKKQMSCISHDQIQKVKELIASCGANYYDAPGEADEFCCMLVLNNHAWACLSEDMDMFVYGAHRILRYMSLINHTFICYDTPGILEELKLTQKEFREISVLSGTDYNTQSNVKIDLYNALKLFKKYKKYNTDVDTSFYDWILINSIFTNENIEILKNIYTMFDLTEFNYNMKHFDKMTANGRVNQCELKKILEETNLINSYPICV